MENITADEPVTITFDSTTTVVAGTYGNVTLVGPGVDEWPEIPEEEPEVIEEEEVPSVVEPSEAPVEEAPVVEEAPAEEAPAEADNTVGVVIGLIVVLASLVAIIVPVVKRLKK